MKLNVAYDETGRILAAAMADHKAAGDRPVAQAGMTVGELDLPAECAGKKLKEFIHYLRVDVHELKLVVKQISS